MRERTVFEKTTLIQCLSGPAIGSSPSTIPMLPDSLADIISCEKGGQPLARPISFGRKGLKRKDNQLAILPSAFCVSPRYLETLRLHNNRLTALDADQMRSS